MVESLTLSTFNAGDVFVVFDGTGQRIELILSRIIPRAFHMPDAKREPFSLIFKGPKTTWLEQGCYRMEHFEVGIFEILIVPILLRDADQQHYYYEACFS